MFSAVNSPLMWSPWKCEITTMSTALGSKPAATMLAPNCPTLPLLDAKAAAPLPVSTTTSLPPVLMTSGANWIDILSFGMKFFSSAALTSSFLTLSTNVSGSAKLLTPSEIAVTWASPTL